MKEQWINVKCELPEPIKHVASIKLEMKRDIDGNIYIVFGTYTFGNEQFYIENMNVTAQITHWKKII